MQNGHLRASYPVPPSSTFCAKPCSLCLHDSKSAVTTRDTYAIIKYRDTQIQRFSQVAGNAAAAPPQPFTSSLKISGNENDFLCLNAVATNGIDQNEAESIVIAAVTKDRNVLMLPRDFSHEPIQVSLNRGTNPSFRMLAAQCISLADAKRGILKHRPDLSETSNHSAVVVVTLDASGRAAGDSVGNLSVKIYTVVQDTWTASSGGAQVTFLTSHTISVPSRWSLAGGREYELGLDASSLLVTTSMGLIKYDLSVPIAHPTAQIPLEQLETHSAKELSAELIAMASPTSIAVFNSRYQSTQSQIVLTKKIDCVTLLEYFPRSQRCLALKTTTSRTTLIAFTITSAETGLSKSAKHGRSALSHSIGKGVANLTGSRLAPLTITNGIGALGIPSTNKVEKLGIDGIGIESVRDYLNNRIPELLETLQRYPSSQIPDRLIDTILQYVVSYSPSVTTQARTEMRIIPGSEPLIKWLISRGNLLRSRLERALRQSNKSNDVVLGIGQIPRALMHFEPALHLLKAYIQLCAKCDRAELVYVVKALLASIITTVQTDSSQDRLEDDMTESMELDTEHQVNPGNHPLQAGLPEDQRTAVMLTDNTSSNKIAVQQALVTALAQLASFSTMVVSKVMREDFESQQILALIQMLRRQLFQSGYSHFTEASYKDLEDAILRDKRPNDSTTSTSTLSLEDTVILLSASIDAIGAVGFSVQGTSDGFVEEIVPDLKSEIARTASTLDGLVAMQNTLRELVRYAESKRSLSSGSTDVLQHNRHSSAMHKRGTIMTLYSEASEEQGDPDAQGGMLPLSLKSEEVSEVKVRKGGGQTMHRTNRELYALRGQQVGRYSLDRITLW